MQQTHSPTIHSPGRRVSVQFAASLAPVVALKWPTVRAQPPRQPPHPSPDLPFPPPLGLPVSTVDTPPPTGSGRQGAGCAHWGRRRDPRGHDRAPLLEFHSRRRPRLCRGDADAPRRCDGPPPSSRTGARRTLGEVGGGGGVRGGKIAAGAGSRGRRRRRRPSVSFSHSSHPSLRCSPFPMPRARFPCFSLARHHHPHPRDHPRSWGGGGGYSRAPPPPPCQGTGGR